MSETDTIEQLSHYLPKVLQYLLAAFFTMTAIGLFTYSITSGTLMLVASALIFPQVQSTIEQQLPIPLSPLFTVGLIAIFVMGASLALIPAVDVMSDGPEFLTPDQ